MLNLEIPNRPFATEPITGLMLPDGVFETSLGAQAINAHIKNTGAATIASSHLYKEAVDDPGIVITPITHMIPAVSSGVAHLFNWQANFSNATPGLHRISFVIEGGGQRRRLIKKIFVTQIGFNPATGAFSAQTPEGVIEVSFLDMVRPSRKGCGCGCGKRAPQIGDYGRHKGSLLDVLRRGFQGHDPEFVFCVPGYLPLRLSVQLTPTPPFAGQYGDLPFQDPWWKVLLCIIAVILLIAAAIAEANGGSGELSTTGPGGAGSPRGTAAV